MIPFQNIEGISPILLSVILIILLAVYELGNEKLKKILLPFIIALIVVFAIMAGVDIYRMYSG